ncbi:hypothetical protein EV279_1742 [Microbacterium sp. BK668]|nr:hypothetical protein EV279_1742 [Microbacterium sp. BK668]
MICSTLTSRSEAAVTSSPPRPIHSDGCGDRPSQLLVIDDAHTDRTQVVRLARRDRIPARGQVHAVADMDPFGIDRFDDELTHNGECPTESCVVSN